MAFPRVPDGVRPAMEKVGLVALYQWLAQSLTSWISTVFWPDGSVKPPSMADTAANNNSIYYSTTASKLVYKDSIGTVHNLW